MKHCNLKKKRFFNLSGKILLKGIKKENEEQSIISQLALEMKKEKKLELKKALNSHRIDHHHIIQFFLVYV